MTEGVKIDSRHCDSGFLYYFLGALRRTGCICYRFGEPRSLRRHLYVGNPSSKYPMPRQCLFFFGGSEKNWVYMLCGFKAFCSIARRSHVGNTSPPMSQQRAIRQLNLNSHNGSSVWCWLGQPSRIIVLKSGAGFFSTPPARRIYIYRRCKRASRPWPDNSVRLASNRSPIIYRLPVDATPPCPTHVSEEGDKRAFRRLTDPSLFVHAPSLQHPASPTHASVGDENPGHGLLKEFVADFDERVWPSILSTLHTRLGGEERGIRL